MSTGQQNGILKIVVGILLVIIFILISKFFLTHKEIAILVLATALTSSFTIIGSGCKNVFSK